MESCKRTVVLSLEQVLLHCRALVVTRRYVFVTRDNSLEFERSAPVCRYFVHTVHTRFTGRFASLIFSRKDRARDPTSSSVMNILIKSFLRQMSCEKLSSEGKADLSPLKVFCNLWCRELRCWLRGLKVGLKIAENVSQNDLLCYFSEQFSNCEFVSNYESMNEEIRMLEFIENVLLNNYCNI